MEEAKRNSPDIQKQCEILEELLENDCVKERQKLNTKEFHAINTLLLEMQCAGWYELKKKEDE